MLRQGAIIVGEEATPLSADSAAGGRVVIQASRENEGFVYIGTDEVDDASGVSLDGGETLTLVVDDLSTVFVADDGKGDAVTFLVT